MDSRSYRIELHREGEVTVLGRSTLVKPHFRALDPFVSQLTREGISGWLLLVDEAAGQIVARRHVELQQRPEPHGSPDPELSGG